MDPSLSQLVTALRIEDIRGFERVMKLLGKRSPYQVEADKAETIKALLKEASSGGTTKDASAQNRRSACLRGCG
jgi:hypothetical protein